MSLLHTGGYLVPVLHFKKTTYEYAYVHLEGHIKNAPCHDHWMIDYSRSVFSLCAWSSISGFLNASRITFLKKNCKSMQLQVMCSVLKEAATHI